jgi:hypothetical protein
MFPLSNAARHKCRWRTIALDFPHRFVGDEISRIGDTPKQSKAWE